MTDRQDVGRPQSASTRIKAALGQGSPAQPSHPLDVCPGSRLAKVSRQSRLADFSHVGRAVVPPPVRGGPLEGAQ